MRYLISVLIGAGILFVMDGAFAGDPATAQDLQGPARVEEFLELGRAQAFSHEALFAVDGKEQAVTLKFNAFVDLTQKTRLEGALSREKVNEALGRAAQTMAPLLPQLTGGISQARTFKQNLDAMGFRGYGLIGPFNTFDARLRLTQNIIDIGAAAGAGEGRAGVNIARYEEEFTRQKIVLTASLLYLEALRAQGAFQAAAAGVALSERLLRQAEARKNAGTAAAIDVARAKTRLAGDQLRQDQARTALHDAYLELQRAAGIPYERAIRLMNSLCFIREAVPSVAEALALAARERLDMRIAAEQARAAGLSLTRARGQWAPVVALAADYGISGNEPRKNEHSTGGVMVSASMSLFDGGRTIGEVREASSRRRQARLVQEDLARQVEEDVRRALWRVTDAAVEVDTAAHVVALARQEMDLASHRFAEGVADHIEVINAQASLAGARDAYVAALTQYHGARMNVYFALGEPGSFFLKDAN